MSRNELVNATKNVVATETVGVPGTKLQKAAVEIAINRERRNETNLGCKNIMAQYGKI